MVQEMTANLDPVPVVRVSGSGRNVGKTTLATHLISWLSERGYRVSGVKRTHHAVPPDRAGSDTDQMAEAGANRVAFVGPDGVLERSGPAPLEDVVARLSADADVVVVEGYRDESLGVQLHLMGAPPARVAMRAGDGRFIRTVSADDLDLIGEFVEQALLVEVTA